MNKHQGRVHSREIRAHTKIFLSHIYIKYEPIAQIGGPGNFRRTGFFFLSLLFDYLAIAQPGLHVPFSATPTVEFSVGRLYVAYRRYKRTHQTPEMKRYPRIQYKSVQNLGARATRNSEYTLTPFEIVAWRR